MPDFDCLRCGTAMQFVGQHKLQLGKTSWIFGAATATMSITAASRAPSP